MSTTITDEISPPANSAKPNGARLNGGGILYQTSESAPRRSWRTWLIGRHLATATESADVRLVLTRRPRRRGDDVTTASPADPTAPRRVLLARCGPAGWLAERAVPTAELAELDWAGLAACAAVPDGWVTAAPVWAV